MSEKILLVDDEKEFLEAMSERMTNRGLDVTTALSAKEAIGKVRKSRPHAIETREQEESLKTLEKSLHP